MLDNIELRKLTSTWPPPDPTIVAIQPYIVGPGKEGIVHRHSYSIADDKGRLKTSTHTYRGLPQGKNSHDDDDDEDESKTKAGIVHHVPPGSIKVTRLMAGALNATFDAATKTLVRHIEEVKRVRVLRIWVDYYIDNSQQLWLAWMGGIVTVSGVGDLRSISGRDKESMVHATSATAGRSLFLGDAGAKMEQIDLERGE